MMTLFVFEASMEISSFFHDTFGEIVCASRTEKICFACVFVPCTIDWMKEMWDEVNNGDTDCM